MIKNIYSILTAILLFIIPTTSFNQVLDKTIQREAKIIDKSLEKSLLWEISGNELEESSYLFGTIHIISSEDYFFPEIAEQSFSEATQVAFEIDMDDMNDFTKLFSIMQDAFMKDGKTLKDLLSDDDYLLVKNHFEKMGMPMMFLEKIKPMFLSVLTSGDIGMGDLQSGGTLSYEMELYEKAQTDSKAVEGLETMEFQMGLFDSIPYEVQAKMLVDGINSSQEGNDQLDEMVKLYKDQNIEGMHNMIEEDVDGLSDFENLLVRKRNENWIPKMQNLMSSGRTFFAVGAGHLGGPNGVVRLLRKAGYKVTPLMHLPGVRRI